MSGMSQNTFGHSEKRPPKDAPRQLSGNLGDRRGKVPSTAWKPGQSGNPGGKPKSEFDLPRACREHAAEAVQRILTAMRNPDDKIAVPAAVAILDRGFGKPNIRVETAGSEPEPFTVLHLVAAREISAHLRQILEAKNGNGAALPPTIGTDADFLITDSEAKTETAAAEKPIDFLPRALE
jgi:hypothetical protein